MFQSSWVLWGARQSCLSSVSWVSGDDIRCPVRAGRRALSNAGREVRTTATGRLYGVTKRQLDLPRLCADFYLLEMAAAKVPGGPAAQAFEMYEREVAPKVSQALEYAMATELKYASGLDYNIKPYALNEGMDCPSCAGDCYLEDIEDNAWAGLNADNGDLWCPGCEIQYQSGEKVEPAKGAYGPSVRFYYKSYNDLGYEKAWNKTWGKYKNKLLIETAKAFHEGMWSQGFGGKKWGTIADVCRDYNLGIIKPRTFLDRAWTLQHNNASVFDKLYDIHKLMTVLEIQASHDYHTLASRFASREAHMLWRRMESWAEVYGRDEGAMRLVPHWIGTGD